MFKKRVIMSIKAKDVAGNDKKVILCNKCFEKYMK